MPFDGLRPYLDTLEKRNFSSGWTAKWIVIGRSQPSRA